MRVATRISKETAGRLAAKRSVVHPCKAVMHRFGVPLALVLGALAILLSYVVVVLLGWRDYAGLIAGMYISEDHTFDMLRCAAFLSCYFGAVVVAPILLIAAPVWSLLHACLTRRSRSPST